MVVTVPGSYPLITTPFPLHIESPKGAVDPVDLTFNLTVTPKPGVFVQVPQSILVVPGAAGTSIRVGFTRTQFTDPVPLSLSNPPAGVTATFTPNPVIDTVSQMLIVADATTALGTYSIGVRANAGLASQATAPVSLTVAASNPISVSLAPTTLTIARGASATTQVNLNRGSYTGNISLVTAGRPPNVTDGFNPQLVAANSSTYTVNVAANAAPGTYTLTVQAFATGYPQATATLTLIVQ
jgi:hypothetical protein